MELSYIPDIWEHSDIPLNFPVQMTEVYDSRGKWYLMRYQTNIFKLWFGGAPYKCLYIVFSDNLLINEMFISVVMGVKN